MNKDKMQWDFADVFSLWGTVLMTYFLISVARVIQNVQKKTSVLKSKDAATLI